MNYAFQPLKKYADFSGRARRKEFWWFTLFFITGSVIMTFLDLMVGTYSYLYDAGLFYVLFILALFIPNLAVSVRRLHDSNRSGWWYLLILIPILGSLALLVLFCQNGTDGPNRFGPDPKTESVAEPQAI
ncbi:MAG: DUF805 domain-containing protein [Alphaproteobacteria bacterium]|nr:DUF805 domain-containing protein [Alphaproteobacteria bacterium]